jgi:hypothetical protein
MRSVNAPLWIRREYDETSWRARKTPPVWASDGACGPMVRVRRGVSPKIRAQIEP